MRPALRSPLLALCLLGSGCQTWTISLPSQSDPEWAYVTALCNEVTDGKHSFRNGRCRICRADQPATPPVAEPEIPPATNATPPAAEDPLPIGTGEPDPNRPGDYAAGTLLKPVSESDGNLIWLLSSKFTGHIESTWMEFEGTRIENGVGAGLWNGDRWHSRFRKPGSAYPDGASLVVRTDSGWRWFYTYPDMGRRWDGNITPKAVRP